MTKIGEEKISLSTIRYWFWSTNFLMENTLMLDQGSGGCQCHFTPFGECFLKTVFGESRIWKHRFHLFVWVVIITFPNCSFHQVLILISSTFSQGALPHGRERIKQIGSNWIKIDQIGWKWIKLDRNRSNWMKMDHNGYNQRKNYEID